MAYSETVFIPSTFVPNYIEETVSIPTGETTRTFFGMIPKDVVRKERQVRQDGYSNCIIDGEALARDVSKAVNRKTEDGFNVLSIVPVTSGNWAYEKGQISGGGGATGGGGRISPIQGDTGYSLGWSFTSGMMITFTKD